MTKNLYLISGMLLGNKIRESIMERYEYSLFEKNLFYPICSVEKISQRHFHTQSYAGSIPKRVSKVKFRQKKGREKRILDFDDSSFETGFLIASSLVLLLVVRTIGLASGVELQLDSNVTLR